MRLEEAREVVEERKRHHIVVHGLVQGVGYRAFVLRTAYSLGVSGWVRNLPDGSVEAEAEAGAATLSRFEAQLKAGPWGADVSRLDIIDLPVSEEPGAPRFEVRI